MMERHLYSVKYRRDDPWDTRTYRLTVSATSADEARAYVKMRDPRFGSTVTSPQRRGAAPEPRCYICRGPLGDDYTRLSDVDGFACWRCREKADLPEDQEFVTVDGGRHGDIAVEWVD